VDIGPRYGMGGRNTQVWVLGGERPFVEGRGKAVSSRGGRGEASKGEAVYQGEGRERPFIEGRGKAIYQGEGGERRRRERPFIKGREGRGRSPREGKGRSPR